MECIAIIHSYTIRTRPHGRVAQTMLLQPPHPPSLHHFTLIFASLNLVSDSPAKLEATRHRHLVTRSVRCSIQAAIQHRKTPQKKTRSHASPPLYQPATPLPNHQYLAFRALLWRPPHAAQAAQRRRVDFAGQRPDSTGVTMMRMRWHGRRACCWGCLRRRQCESCAVLQPLIELQNYFCHDKDGEFSSEKIKELPSAVQAMGDPNQMMNQQVTRLQRTQLPRFFENTNVCTQLRRFF